jgi:serine/threonine-protein kinase
MLGEYVITAPVGRGGFGTIWLAKHRSTGEQVAIKVLHAELAVATEMISRFEREARVIAMIKHPNVVALHDVGELGDGRPYLVMEYLDGTSLRTIVKEGGALPADEVLSMLEPLASALSAAHAHGVIHRDVKASNVMICERDGERRVVLLDFGVAKLLEDKGPRITAPLAAVGSPHSMSPEQIRGEEVDARTDVYALGTLAFYMLTGEPPFPGKRGEAMTRHLLDERPRPSDRLDITTAFDDVVTRAMSRDRKDRYPSVEEFVAAFRAAASTRRTRTGDAPIAPEESIRALGLYIDVKMDGSADDDAVCDDAEAILPLAERHLSGRGYLLVQEIGNSGLFVLPVPETFEEMRSWPRRVVKDASMLMRVLEQRSGRHPRVQVQVHMHLGEAARAGDMIDSGPLLEPSSWNSTKKWHGGMWISSDAASELHVHATPSSGDR